MVDFGKTMTDMANSVTGTGGVVGGALSPGALGALYNQMMIGNTASGYDTLSAQQSAIMGMGGKGKKARKAREKAAQERAKQELQAKTGAMQDYQYAKAEKAMKTGISGVEKAYDEAKLQAARGAEQARQSVRDYGKAQGAEASQSMMNRGLYGTTVQDQAQRVVSSDVARNLGAIDTGLAAQQGELGVAKAGAKQAGLGQLASLYPQLAGLKTETMFNMMKALQTPAKKKKTPWYKKALGAVGQIVGNAIAPGIGGAIAGGITGMFGGGGGGGASSPTFDFNSSSGAYSGGWDGGTTFSGGYAQSRV